MSDEIDRVIAAARYALLAMPAEERVRVLRCFCAGCGRYAGCGSATLYCCGRYKYGPTPADSRDMRPIPVNASAVQSRSSSGSSSRESTAEPNTEKRRQAAEAVDMLHSLSPSEHEAFEAMTQPEETK